MIRAPSYIDDNTRTFARTCPGFGKTAAQMAVAIEVHRTPRHRRPGTWWIAMVVMLAAIVFLSGCTSDVEAEDATAANLRDAVAQAQAERPELWSDEQKARARVAAQIVARQP